MKLLIEHDGGRKVLAMHQLMLRRNQVKAIPTHEIYLGKWGSDSSTATEGHVVM